MSTKITTSASADIIFNLKVLAKEREHIRRKLAVTAEELRIKAKLLAVTAKQLKRSHETLEGKVLERTKNLEMARAKEGAILQSIGDGLLATDDEGKITFINATAEKLLGKKSDDVVGKVYAEIIPLEDDVGVTVPAKYHPVKRALARHHGVAASIAHPTYYHVRSTTTKIPLSIMATPVMLEGQVIGTIEVFRDISYEREIDKAKTEFVSLASHQLRTPLSTVNWYAEMLLAGDVGPLNEQQTKYLGEVYRSNQRMVELVNALLDVSRLELGTFVVEPEGTDIVALIQDVINEQKPEIEKKKLQCFFATHKKSYQLFVDPKHARMVVQNILSNAIKYTPHGGTIEVAIARTRERRYLFTVKDTGYGIPKEQQDKIFTKLFRADNVRDKDTDGTGLGLYIVKSILDNSGGKIWFSSEEDKGTTFSVLLPVDKKQL